MISLERKSIRICYPFVGDSIGGSHLSTLLLAEGLARTRYEPIIAIHEHGPLAEYLRARRIRAEFLPLPYYAGRTPRIGAIGAGMLRNLPRLAGFLKRHRIGIVHANDLRMNLTWSVAAKLTGRPFIWHQRALPYSSSPLWQSIRFLSDHVIYISDVIARTMPAIGRTPTSVIADPVASSLPTLSREVAKSAVTQEFGLDPSVTIVGFVGRLVGLKRPDVFVAAGARLARQLPNVKLAFILVGHDERRMGPELQRLAASMGIEKHVFLAGFRHRIEEWIAGMDLLMATSEREGFGRSLVEAMALGTPVIAAGAAGHLEIIDHERTGLLVSPNDADAFAAAAHRILADSRLASRLTKAARAHAIDRYSLQRHADLITSIYDRLGR